jgi:hypothetical protein
MWPNGRSWAFARGSATNKMREAIKTCSVLIVQKVFRSGRIIEDSTVSTGLFQSSYYVRFYHEYIRPGSPLEFAQTLTVIDGLRLNDELLDRGLTLRRKDPKLVTLQPSPKRWLPSVTLPPEFRNWRERNHTEPYPLGWTPTVFLFLFLYYFSDCLVIRSICGT